MKYYCTSAKVFTTCTIPDKHGVGYVSYYTENFFIENNDVKKLLVSADQYDVNHHANTKKFRQTHSFYSKWIVDAISMESGEFKLSLSFKHNQFTEDAEFDFVI